jgi:hypothetical protein
MPLDQNLQATCAVQTGLGTLERPSGTRLVDYRLKRPEGGGFRHTNRADRTYATIRHRVGQLRTKCKCTGDWRLLALRRSPVNQGLLRA